MSADPDQPDPGVVPGTTPDETNSTSLNRIPLTVTVRKEYPDFAAFVAEFGEHIYPEGMFIPTSRPRPKGAQVKVDFQLQNGLQILVAICEVIRCDEALPGMLSGMWVSFKVVDDAYRELILKIYSERETSREGVKPEEIAPSSRPTKDEKR